MEKQREMTAEQLEHAYNMWVVEKLKEAEEEAKKPGYKTLSYEEVFGKYREKYGYDV